jgi:hypothetical protein
MLLPAGDFGDLIERGAVTACHQVDHLGLLGAGPGLGLGRRLGLIFKRNFLVNESARR